jgi:diguanylate cyclase (GGDEF)-like protein
MSTVEDRRVISEPSGNPRRDDLSRFDDHLRYISTALFGAGMLVVFLVGNFNLVRPQAMDQLALNSLVAAAGASVVGILLFPWHRYHRNLFLVAVLDGMCLITLAIYFSGGWESPFFPFYFFVVIFCAIYFSARMLGLVVLLTLLVSLMPQLYAPDTSMLVEHTVVRVPTYLALAFVSWYMARETGRRERLRGEYERRLQEAQELKDRFQLEAYTDRLTNLPNRARFWARLQEELGRARHGGEEFTVLFLDVDDFKRINDERGHQIGDESLKLIANVLRFNAREIDMVARHGGDEFTVLLADTPLSGAQEFFSRFREELANHSELKLGFTVSLSGGAATFPCEAGTADSLLEVADLALYRAKHRGKNQLFHPSMEVV